MRARWLKPEFFRDRKMATLGALAALVFQALWCIADDAGTAPCDPDRIKGELFFAWNEVDVPVIIAALESLEDAKRIRRYHVGDDAYCRIVNFQKHQAVHKPSKFRYPKESQADTKEESPQCGTGGSPVQETPGTPHILDTKTPRHLDTSTTSAAVPHDERVEEVLAHFAKTHPKRHPGNPKDRSAIKRALTHYAVTELCLAIDGNARDPWHQDRSKHELTYVLRDSGKIDQFIALAAKPPLPQSSNGAPQRKLTIGEKVYLKASGGVT